MNNSWFWGLKLIVVDIILDFFYWPIWWYTTGFKDALIFCGRQIREAWRSLALGIWLKNMLTPMYGDRSFLGRAISFVARLVILTWRLAWMFIWLLIIIGLAIIWVVAPIYTVWMIMEHIKVLF
ncbi:MAG TPA: hypothetical protein PLR18_02540 [bacterium]|nr:hypothetical protein [bacterium]